MCFGVTRVTQPQQAGWTSDDSYFSIGFPAPLGWGDGCDYSDAETYSHQRGKGGSFRISRNHKDPEKQNWKLKTKQLV